MKIGICTALLRAQLLLMIDVKVSLKYQDDPVAIGRLIHSMTAPLSPLWYCQDSKKIAVAERIGLERVARMERLAKGRRLPA